MPVPFFNSIGVTLAVITFLGHTATVTYLINRLHAASLPCRFIRAISMTLVAAGIALPSAVIWGALRHVPVFDFGRWPWAVAAVAWPYLIVCWMMLARVVAAWCWRQMALRRCPWLVKNDTIVIDVARRLGHRPTATPLTTALTYFPGNEVLKLAVHEKVIGLPRLPPVLDGFSIAHLSDLHFTGQLTRAYFDEVVRETNRLDADLVAITGDILDKPRCLPWISQTLGRLGSREGVYFVLGNHERRLKDVGQLRRTLVAAGLIDLGGRSVRLSPRGADVLLAGNELPWFGPAANLDGLPPRGAAERPLTIALAHTPDQIDWARSQAVDLLLAGHTHGGQVRLPLVGPIFSPSRFGVYYAAGTFFEPPTLMHVSRGVSGSRQLRINCPPEITKLVLKTGQT